jgi:hypothetical protein
MPPTIITKESLYKRISELERKHCCNKNQFFDTFAEFPEEGQKGILYIDESTGDIYVWVVDAFVLAGDKFHSNIVGTGAYDAGLPLTNWTPPLGAIEGNTAQVKFTDGTIVNYTYDGAAWTVDFVDDAAVSGTGATNRVAFWSDANTLSSDADLYWDDVNNRLGVGTATPSELLYVEKNQNAPTYIVIDNPSVATNARTGLVLKSGGLTKGYFQYNNASLNFFLSAAGNFPLYLGTNSNINLTINESGNVGIGTTSPTHLLDVDGDALINGLTVGKGAGNIGTNTAAGSGALQNNTTGNYNTASGYHALSSNTTGGYNTASGYRALFSNTTGSQNTASGQGALSSNTTGNYNTASGYQALFSNTTGSQNTASGYQALFSNTTGYSNAASGYRALFSNTTGSQNTASGQGALSSNTTGNYNTASGQDALSSNTTGGYNTASGQGALSSNTTGNYNTASGQEALFSNTTGSQNTASGQGALSSNTTGSQNTASGYQALFSNTTGGYNTASGYRALFSNTTGSQNTASGQGALSSNTTGNYNTASGQDALSSNTTGGYNTASGQGALSSNTTGSQNTASGQGALSSNTTGNYNTASGRLSGGYTANGSANTVTDNSVYLGFDSRALADNQTNQIVVGHTAIGGGSNTATIGNSFVTVLYLSGAVGWFQGNGAPEGVVTAPIGSFYSRKDGGAGTSFYVKESGSGNTGWIGK